MVDAMPSYLLHRFWIWLVDTGFNLGLLIILALLIPRIGRLAMRIVERKVRDEHEDESKAHLAIAGVAVYIAQLIAYFVIFVFLLQQLGFSLASAAIPATAASAAIGLGAQSLIADFLAGFFILTERQYGVGDLVRFQGGAANVEGTVIQITMRATRIRTLAQETVIIPNSKAGVCINNSNYWSKAVCTMPVPLLGSSSIYEAVERATQATKAALARPEIRPNVLDELEVHPAIDVIPPATVGTPWSVTMRFLVRVTPGNQYIVERAMRTAVIHEFWPEYGSAPTLNGTVADTLAPAFPEELERAARGNARHSTGLGPSHAPWNAHDTSGEAFASAPDARVSDSSEDAAGVSAPRELRQPANTAATESVNSASRDPEATRVIDHVGDLKPGSIERDPSDPATEEDLEEESTTDPRQEYTGWRRTITLHGRTRVSTAMLLLGFIGIIVLKGLTWAPTDEAYTGSSGWLAPNRSKISAPQSSTPVPATPSATAPATTEPAQPTLEPTTPDQVRPTEAQPDTNGGATETPPNQTTQTPTTEQRVNPLNPFEPTDTQAPASATR